MDEKERRRKEWLHRMHAEFMEARRGEVTQLAISRAQKQFDNEEDQKMKEWLRENAAILLDAGTPTDPPERYR